MVTELVMSAEVKTILCLLSVPINKSITELTLVNRGPNSQNHNRRLVDIV